MAVAHQLALAGAMQATPSLNRFDRSQNRNFNPERRSTNSRFSSGFRKRLEDLFPILLTVPKAFLQDYRKLDLLLTSTETSLTLLTATYNPFHQGITQFFRNNNKTGTKDPTPLLSLTSKDSQKLTTWEDPTQYNS